MENINQLKQAISKLDEREAKALLNLIFIRAEQYEEDEMTRILQSIKKSLLQVSRNEEKIEHRQTVHILFGDSPAGSLKAAFRNNPYAKTEEIIVLPHILSVGPIESLHTKKGIENRFQWFKEHYRDDFNDLEEYKQGMLKAIEKIKEIPPYQQILIWTCENAAEQIGLRVVLYLLQNKVNEVFELNTFKVFHELYTYPMLEEEQYPRTSGELAPEKLLQFYEQFEFRSMDCAKRHALLDEGRKLLLSESLLRTWDNDELWHSDVERDDDFIIHCAKKLHKERGKHDYMKAARLIGEVIGHMHQYTGDQWIEYRLRDLIGKEIFTYRGELSAMRLYEVKLKEELLH
ncbi:DUF1835 domain-containing protein [Neobacillus sp. YX16]|uniref:DUF1835 domain-containing protein n=1 Tax=Neobacillus sp. YX16 TaxID=3047874 RepID=UPI0024C22EB4|nr:DUF1835 domain-containing protein [Neobacillus sp. YX16]WHZ02881.1 DUF1835 domain-containing protein [Neobacillus sp. YX16]